MENMNKGNGTNDCNYCGGRHGWYGCKGDWGGGKYFLIKCLLALLLLIIVFCGGFKLGMIVGYIGGGYGQTGYPSMMNRNWDKNYNPTTNYNPMMNGWQYNQQLPQTQNQ